MNFLQELFRFFAMVTILLCTALGFAFIAFAIYNTVSPDTLRWSLIALTVVLCLLVCRALYRVLESRGVIEFMTVPHASPELDNLELNEASSTKAFDEAGFLSYCQEGHCIKGGHIRIYGDHKKRGLKSPHYFQRIAVTNNDLLMEFQSGAQLKVDKPTAIQVSDAFIKIQSADRVKWSWPNKQIDFVYQPAKEGIVLESPSGVEHSNYDALPYHPAVFISV